jgi:hypothetical protein
VTYAEPPPPNRIVPTPNRCGANSLVLDLHQVESVTRASDEEELHDRVVQRHVRTREEVDVARNEDDKVEELGLE